MSLWGRLPCLITIPKASSYHLRKEEMAMKCRIMILMKTVGLIGLALSLLLFAGRETIAGRKTH